MKAFIISSATILLLLLFSCIYSIYISNVLDEILAIIQNLPEDSTPSEHQLEYLDKAHDIWNDHRIILHLFVDDRHHTAADLAFKELQKYAIGSDYPNYLCAIEKFSSAINDIKVIEGRSFFSIF